MPRPYMVTDLHRRIKAACKDIAKLLIEKNLSYGNSATEPMRIFAKGIDTKAQLLVRIDDKLSRIARGGSDLGEDTLDDLIGYLILLKVSGGAEQCKKHTRKQER